MPLTPHSFKSGARLLAAALALPGVGGLLPTKSFGQEIVATPSIRLAYAEYRDYQSGLESRMRVHTPQVWAELPVGENTEIKAGMVYDSMSGASPYYLNSLSGASNQGVRDQRFATQLAATHRFANFSIGLTTSFSDENDYTSKGLAPEIRWWNSDQSTTWIFGTALTRDIIASSFNEDLSEHRITQAARIAVNQIISPIDLVQVGLSVSSGDGYWSDPYKAFDTRPKSREMYAGVVRYRRFLKGAESALHVDARIYGDSWGVVSPSIETALAFKLGQRTYKPLIRYSYQERARFFSSDYPPQTVDGFFSPDQRLGSFGSIGIGLRFEQRLNEWWSNSTFDASIFTALQDPNLFPGATKTSRNLEPFYYGFVMLGITKRFS